jgi:RHS repeat-associated protein
VGRTDSSGTTQYLYGDPANPFQLTAVRDPAGTLTALYYDETGVVYAFQRGSSRYYVASDQVGSPRIVSDSTGTVVKALTYDSFGTVLSDSSPGFALPVGFAGGIPDPTTGLVHFEYRDYDPASSRWTGRDPALYDGSQGNLFTYVGNDPVSLRDPWGLFCIGGSAYEGVGGGGSFCIDNKGISACAELGFGIGGSLEANPFGGPADQFFGIQAEGSAGVKGVAALTASVSYNAFNPCPLQATGGVQVGPADLQLLSNKGWDPKFKKEKGPLSDYDKWADKFGKFGASGKVVAKVCENAFW